MPWTKFKIILALVYLAALIVAACDLMVWRA